MDEFTKGDRVLDAKLNKYGTVLWVQEDRVLVLYDTDVEQWRIKADWRGIKRPVSSRKRNWFMRIPKTKASRFLRTAR